MRWLAETTVATEFLPVESIVVSASALPAADRDFWSRMSADSKLRFHDSGSGPTDDFWTMAAIVGESSRSQFDLLVDCARTDVNLPDESFACLALTGDRFHGNRNRSWKALLGNLHFSSFCKMTLNAADCGPELSMLPTVAVTDVLISLMNKSALNAGTLQVPTPWIKWVNDVYLDDSKISGSLVSSQVVEDQIVSFVLGIGLNVATAPDLEGQTHFGGATSLRQEGLEVPLGEVFQGLMKALATRIPQLREPSGRAQISSDYHGRLGGIGRFVELYPDSADNFHETPVIAVGRLAAVHADLSIEIEGSPRRFRNGRLRFASQSS
jgi:biotin-(acetyl-CoA carboxylase) ligase